MPLRADFLEVLACPQCKGELEYQEKESRLTCSHCRLIYEIEEEIPIMLLEKAKGF